MTPSGTDCRLEISDTGAILHLSGDWLLDELRPLSGALQAAALTQAAGLPLRLDGSGLQTIDLAAALLVLRRIDEAGLDVRRIELDGFADSHRRIVELVAQRFETLGKRSPSRLRDAITAFGAYVDGLLKLGVSHLGFLGVTLVSLAGLFRSPSSLRRRELFAQFGQTCTTAIPVVSLVMFLIGVVVAYLLGLQAAQYGANIFVVDGVALGMVREFSPLLVAVIVAGRSGAAFTAQLGTMKLTEEIDAIRTLGLSPEQVLLVPGVLALVIGLPLLVFVGDIMGMAGAALICGTMLDITVDTFVSRVQDVLAVRHYLIGLAKAPVFALFIAVIGCSMGMTVSRDTRSIGINTTSTVVQSIVTVILLDAFIAVLMQEIGL